MGLCGTLTRRNRAVDRPCCGGASSRSWRSRSPPRVRSPLRPSTASTTSATATPSSSATAGGSASSRSTRPRFSSGASATAGRLRLRTKALLLPGTRVRLLPEPATDRVDDYGRLLRYVVRVRDGVNVNIRLVAVSAAGPYFYRHRRGKYARRLDHLARRARAKKLGLWRACPRTRYNPYEAIATRR